MPPGPPGLIGITEGGNSCPPGPGGPGRIAGPGVICGGAIAGRIAGPGVICGAPPTAAPAGRAIAVVMLPIGDLSLKEATLLPDHRVNQEIAARRGAGYFRFHAEPQVLI